MAATIDEKLVAAWSNVKSSVPESYVQPPEIRPGDTVVAPNKAIPVIDLSSHDRTQLVSQVLKASEEFGFFQVVNHEVPKDLIDDALKVYSEFNALPPNEKASETSKDPNGSCKLYTSSEYNYNRERVHYWKDVLTHHCLPMEKYAQYWPSKPARYGDVIGKYVQEVRNLGLKLLDLICEGLGISSGFFSDELSNNPILIINYYPPCPDPTLTLGSAKHRDPSLITLLLQEEVSGLQVFKDGEWIAVDPIPYAFVVNIGLVLQFITNGRLIGAEHRAVTNSSVSRTSVVCFVYPSYDTVIEPAKAIVNASNPPIYKSITFGEFRKNFYNKGNKFEQEMKLQQD